MAAVIRRASASLGSMASQTLLAPKQTAKPQVCGMVSKHLRDKDYKLPPPFPYKEKKYGFVAAMFDRTTWRFDENSKIIVVDGPFATGKAQISKHIAEEFDLLHIPHAHMDAIYVNSYGYDMRQLNDKMPYKVRSFDPIEFLANPKDVRATRLQLYFFKVRLSQYLDALGHVLSTGQGVVMDRSVYSDFVLVETFIKAGFVPKTYMGYYKQLWDCLRPDLLRPHLVVYLDAPVDTILENIKKRGNPVEISSLVYQPEVLKTMEDIYKQQFLKEISKHSELLVYDWSEPVDLEILVEDIERVNLDNYWIHDPKMDDWRWEDEWTWNNIRMRFTTDREQLEIWVGNIPHFECSELILDGETTLQYSTILENAPGNKYRPGYNDDMGDPNVLFKI